jgi:hypothetical protein
MSKEKGLAAAKKEIKMLEGVLGLFIVAARHARNFPHPEIPVTRIRAEATQAESNAERQLGADRYGKICDKFLK